MSLYDFQNEESPDNGTIKFSTYLQQPLFDSGRRNPQLRQ